VPPGNEAPLSRRANLGQQRCALRTFSGELQEKSFGSRDPPLRPFSRIDQLPEHVIEGTSSQQSSGLPRDNILSLGRGAGRA
jgi:hypothetical protein